ncbi:hypothetical protein [Rhodopirellula sp. P2]|uniref:hypothetical protein n=1 Tax=Rhodopirellula sp. P2 TaxID=2127060 RepID=UPI002368331B|nr:hypothetical protein [Rhodopirellula sp. P2]WDQ17356.1 hypothetical protein PSR62_02085 [Rhodopirellula sp. P2]
MTRCLASEVYPLHMNVGYSHGLTDSQLHATLLRMQMRGLIGISSALDDAESSVTLTPAGGEQWSLERAPVWDRFIFENGSLSGERLTVVAANESIGRRYIGSRIAAGIKVQAGPIRVRRGVSASLIPWKRFQNLVVLRLDCDPPTNRPVDWDVYESMRTWWTSLAELSTLLQR